jgi:hypothetical protein
MLGAAEAPPELVELERKRPLVERLQMRIFAAKPFWAIAATLLGALIAFVLLWLLVHIREWRLLRVSLYNVEHEYLAGIDSEPRR